MPKTDKDFDPADYTPVAERVAAFHARYPTGRIETEPLRVTEQMVLFRASLYRTAEDLRPAATGWAAERPGDGEINEVACVENTETSAVGRALANLGITGGRQRPSREEMEQAESAKARLRTRRAAASEAAASDAPALGPLATPDDLAELEELLSTAERRGFDDRRASEVRALLERTRVEGRADGTEAEPVALVTIQALQRELRDWLRRSDRARG